MSLTRKDREEIVELIKATIQNTAISEAEDDALNKQAEAWAENSIKSELAGIEIAPADLWVKDENGDEKKYFTADEADEIVAKLPDGWRLPTRHEIALMIEEFANNPETGLLDDERMRKALNLEPGGCQDPDDGEIYYASTYGYWWSATASNTAGRYRLYYNTSNGFFSDYYGRYDGYYVRCVRTS